MNRFAFGDFVVTTKPVPNVKRGSVVRVIGMVVTRGRLFYSTAHVSKDGMLTVLTELPMLPENALGFQRAPTPAEAQDLLLDLFK